MIGVDVDIHVDGEIDVDVAIDVDVEMDVDVAIDVDGEMDSDVEYAYRLGASLVNVDVGGEQSTIHVNVKADECMKYDTCTRES